MKTSIRKSAIVVAMVLSCMVGAVSADTMTYNGMGLKSDVHLYAPGINNLHTYAGQMLVEYGGQNHIGYCVDIYHSVGTMEATELTLSSLHNGDMVAFLFETYANTVSTGIEAAALQVAIWEVINEDDVNGFNAEIDDLYITGNLAVLEAANILLASLPTNGYTPTNDFMVLHNDGKQDILIMVPEPGTMVMLCLGGVYSLIRRRRRK